MPLKESEAIVLRTYPFREADLLVTLFTRELGKIRGVARAAKKSRRRFGGALEPLSYVKATFDIRERHELVRLDACEVLDSPMRSQITYDRSVALSHIAELIDEMLPDHEASDPVFRLAISGLRALRDGRIWMPVTYFELWMMRLMGYLPEIQTCIACGLDLNGERAFFHALYDGLTCADDKRIASSELSPESRIVASRMFRSPIDDFSGIDWPRELCADLRKMLMQIAQRHIEKKLATPNLLEKLGR